MGVVVGVVVGVEVGVVVGTKFLALNKELVFFSPGVGD